MNFLAFIGKIVGQDVLREFETKETLDYTDLLREFETKKRTMKSSMDSKITCKMPSSMMTLFQENGGDVSTAITGSGFVGKVSWVGDKFRIDPSIGVSFFDESIKITINHVRNLLSNPALNKLNTIILVGGFSECELVQEAFRSNVGQEMIIVPEGGGIVILKGAVISGHIPRAITTRIARFTYGMDVWPNFDSSVHPAGKLVYCDGIAKGKDVFSKWVEKGEPLELGRTVTRKGRPVRANQTELDYALFISSETSPKFVTDKSCRLLGKCTIPLPDGKSTQDKKIVRSMILGDAEISFIVEYSKTGQKFKTYFRHAEEKQSSKQEEQPSELEMERL